jgi:pyridinium-3,5-bisthiocarboxylic acid mononucleotide nickel chelatase
MTPHPHPCADATSPSEGAFDDRPRLAAGCAEGKVLFFDAFSGLSGDMINSALIDLGAPIEVAQDAVQSLGVQGVELHQARRVRSGVSGAQFAVTIRQPQPERTWESIDQMLARSPLQGPVVELARRIFRTIARAEAHVHQVPMDHVHLHEVGAADAIADVVGATALLHWLAAGAIVCSPLPMGRGTVRARHGVLPLPAPATLECLQGVPTYSVDVDGETVTPTGAAIIATVAQRFERWPAFSPERVGYGTGDQDFPDRPNLLRVVLGSPASDELATDSGSHHMVLETNVDDMTGELTAHSMQMLMCEGALDVWATPMTTKKGRPGLTLCALVERERVEPIAHCLLRETTSLGVRIHPVSRVTRPRERVQVQTPYGPVTVKVGAGSFGPQQVKPEFDECAKVAQAAGVPVREVLAAAIAAFRQGKR